MFNRLKLQKKTNFIYVYLPCNKKNNMKSSENNILIDNYWGLIDSLTRENKIKLMAKLSVSIAENKEETNDVVDAFFGAFKSNESCEEMILKIRESRNFNREIESF